MVPFELVRAIHEDRLRQAEKRRLYTQRALATPLSARRLLLHLGDTLIRFGVRLIEIALVHKAHERAQAQPRQQP